VPVEPSRIGSAGVATGAVAVRLEQWFHRMRALAVATSVRRCEHVRATVRRGAGDDV